MELFERVRYISSIKDISLAKMANSINIQPQTFHKWLDAKSQRNLWEHLPKILEMFPDVRPEWLYMDQGAALRDGTAPEPLPTAEEVNALKTRVAELETELRDADRLNRRLTERLLEGAKQGGK